MKFPLFSDSSGVSHYPSVLLGAPGLRKFSSLPSCLPLLSQARDLGVVCFLGGQENLDLLLSFQDCFVDWKAKNLTVLFSAFCWAVPSLGQETQDTPAPRSRLSGKRVAAQAIMKMKKHQAKISNSPATDSADNFSQSSVLE